MAERIGEPPKGVGYPVWAWHTWEFERKAPDPDSAAFLRRTEEKVLFTLEIPDNRVVLTDFDAWQGVMMHTFVSAAETEEEFAALDDLISGLSEDEFEAEIVASWENVFLTDPVENAYITRGKFVQATFWEIRKEYVKETAVLPANA